MEGYNKESLTMDNSWCSVLSGYNKAFIPNPLPGDWLISTLG
jgi:hypothetical protein